MERPPHALVLHGNSHLLEAPFVPLPWGRGGPLSFDRGVYTAAQQQTSTAGGASLPPAFSPKLAYDRKPTVRPRWSNREPSTTEVRALLADGPPRTFLLHAIVCLRLGVGLQTLWSAVIRS